MADASWPIAVRGEDSDIDLYGPNPANEFGILGPYECRGCPRKIFIQMNVHQAHDHLVGLHVYMGEKVPEAALRIVAHLHKMQRQADAIHKAERS
jgi:diaminopimelate decarboxylase